MDKRKILIQLDSDRLPSVFDRVVAVDAGVDELFSYGGVKPEQVRDLVHGAIFTRGPKDLKNTALFIGGSDVTAGERLLAEAVNAMLPKFGLRSRGLRAFPATSCASSTQRSCKPGRSRIRGNAWRAMPSMLHLMTSQLSPNSIGLKTRSGDHWPGKLSA